MNIVGGQMKRLVFIVIFFYSIFGYAEDKDNLKSFSKALNKNISEVIKDNPEIYEKKKPAGRKPASVDALHDEREDIETLDDIDVQGNTHTNW